MKTSWNDLVRQGDGLGSDGMGTEDKQTKLLQAD